MNISKLASIALFGSALMAYGCSEDGGTGGTGGGTGGAGGGEPVACEATTDRCVNGEIGRHVPCCEQLVPDQANACDGTESVVNPASCTVLDGGVNAVTHTLTIMEIEGNCNVGYDLDSCDGGSCFPGGLAPAEGELGVDNAVAALAPTLEGVGGNLSGVNQALADTICGITNDAEMGTCTDTGTCSETATETCESDADCPGSEVCEGTTPCTSDGDCTAPATCDFDDDDCADESGTPADIRFVVDPNPGENCANVTVLSGETVGGSYVLNLSDGGCASGTLGSIALNIGGISGSLDNTVVRMTVSGEGFSDGLLGATIDENTAVGIAEALLEGGGAVVAQVLDINASTPPDQDTANACNALSATMKIGGTGDGGNGGGGQ